MENHRNIVLEKSSEFGLKVIDFCQELKRHNHHEIANQLLRSGTSVGANIFEAQSAESRQDFIHKMKLAKKEAFESRYWLWLCKNSEYLPGADALEEKAIELNKILNRIIATTKESLKTKNH
jgi:four helix bundle protein